jgi:tetratricopeptide (TPR) repeat protein
MDGKTIGMDLDGPGNDKGMYALAAVRRETSLRNEDVIKWSSFRGKLGGKVRAAFMSQVSPDGQYVVTTILDPLTAHPERDHDPIDDKFYGVNFKDYRFLQVFYPTRGVLAWYSRQAGHLQTLPGADDPRYVQTDGFWSPDGKYLVFARAEAKAPYREGVPRAKYANDPNETQIQYDLYRMPFNGGRGGQPERIAGASENSMSNNFPKVSPDSRWIVFVQCRNGQLMRPDSRLYIVPFKGGQARLMKCNTPLMNSWHSFSPNGRWMVFSSKSRSPYTQMYLTHIAEDGTDSPAILIENTTAANRAVNIPEFVNVPKNGLQKMNAPATDFFAAFDRASDLMAKKELDAAILEWRKAVELNPSDDRCHFNLAVALDQQGLLGEAAQHYQKTIQLEPDNVAAYIDLAGVLTRQGKPDAALELYTQAVEKDPGSALAQGDLAAALVERGRTAEAAEHGRLALQADPDFADGHNMLGIILARGGRFDDAVAHLERAVALVPDSPEYRFNLGRVLAARRSFAEAIPQFEKAVELTGGNEPQSIEMLAAMYAELGHFSEAAQTARRALEVAGRQNDVALSEELRTRIVAYESQPDAPRSKQ